MRLPRVRKVQTIPQNRLTGSSGSGGSERKTEPTVDWEENRDESDIPYKDQMSKRSIGRSRKGRKKHIR